MQTITGKSIHDSTRIFTYIAQTNGCTYPPSSSAISEIVTKICTSFKVSDIVQSDPAQFALPVLDYDVLSCSQVVHPPTCI